MEEAQFKYIGFAWVHLVMEKAQFKYIGFAWVRTRTPPERKLTLYQ
jgi:hypothetical protein